MTQALEIVTKGDFKVFGIMPATDTTIEQALATAGRMREEGEFFEAAVVDTDGVVIFDPGKAYRMEFAEDLTGFWLRTPRLGGTRKEQLAAATILSLYRLGQPEQINRQLASQEGPVFFQRWNDVALAQ